MNTPWTLLVALVFVLGGALPCQAQVSQFAPPDTTWVHSDTLATLASEAGWRIHFTTARIQAAEYHAGMDLLYYPLEGQALVLLRFSTSGDSTDTRWDHAEEIRIENQSGELISLPKVGFGLRDMGLYGPNTAPRISSESHAWGSAGRQLHSWLYVTAVPDTVDTAYVRVPFVDTRLEVFSSAGADTLR